MPDLKILNEMPFSFYNEVFSIYYTSNGRFYIPINRICDAVGVDAASQRTRIQKSPVMSDKTINLRLPTPYRGGIREQDVLCLDLTMLTFWMGTLDPSRVKEEIAEKLVLYQREFADAAWDVFRSDIVPEDILAEVDTLLPPEVRRYHVLMDEAHRLKRELDKTNSDVGSLTSRIGRIEQIFDGVVFINDHQAYAISKMIIAIGLKDFERDSSKTKGMWIALSYHDFYEKFDLASYKLLPADRYEKACKFLQGRWRQKFPGYGMPPEFNFDQKTLWEE